MSENFEESLHDIYRAAGLSERIMKLGQEAEAQCKSRFAEIDAIAVQPNEGTQCAEKASHR